jgi:prolyl-tRNA editing enzyme YbaK/EbsC (Cys-tRNA(Pro) deacylase)
MDKKIQKYLETSGIKFTPIKHRKVYTAYNAAETQGVNMKEVVKTVLVKFDKAIAFLEEPTPSNSPLEKGRIRPGSGSSPFKGEARRGESLSLKIEKFNMVLVAIPAGKHLDFKKIDKFVLDTQTKLYKKLSKANPKLPKPIKVKSSIAKEKDIAGKLKTKYLLAPLPIYETPLLVDKKLSLNKNLTFSAGSFTESVKVTTKQYLKVVNPLLGSFNK